MLFVSLRSPDVLMQWQGRCLIFFILFLQHQVALAFGFHQIADERIAAFSALDRYLACKKKKFRFCLTGESQDALCGAVIHFCRSVSGREQFTQDMLSHRSILGSLVYEVLRGVFVISLCL